MVNIMNHELSKLVLWLKSNRLSLNIKKTKFMVFSNKPILLANASIKICNDSIEQVQFIKFLGVIIDC